MLGGIDYALQHSDGIHERKGQIEKDGECEGGGGNINTNPRLIDCENVEWIHLAQDMLQWRVL
jgi:hypothetical protein